MFEILFKAVNESIQSWTKEYGNYIPGFYTVLHSFGSDIKYNPHFHVLITAGGLRLDKKKWKKAPDKCFRLVRGYGLFSNCIKKKLLKKVLRLLKRRERRRIKNKTWRDNYIELTGIDPLICERCHIEMEFWFARYGPDERVFKHFGLNVSERIPVKQFVLKSA